ncbi:MAG TPA: serine/threonine-protein kinase, partial [Candidatus Hydrogenedentes bacterium]|nr:serine/threonine-protein kinase [Candidatus Hydrogenedentota bacterium]
METGSILGKYHILTQLGRGGMGVVYLAEDTTLRRQIALKVLDQSITSTPHFESRFLQEARLVASLNHPNIVPIHALEQINGEWILEMPYIEGGSLMDAEARGTLDLRQMLKCVRDVLLALAVCHEAGIIHRDVKPSNILLDNQCRGMLSDFGLAKLLSLRQRDSLDSN